MTDGDRIRCLWGQLHSGCPSNAEYKIAVTIGGTGEPIRFDYLCAEHAKEAYGPWLNGRASSI